MKKVALLFVCLALAISANANVVYNSIGGTSTGTITISTFAPYASFSTGSQSGSLLDVSFFLKNNNLNQTGEVDVALYGNSATANQPGSLIAILGSILDQSVGATLATYGVHADLGANSLSADTRYWIVLTATDNSIRWANTNFTSWVDPTDSSNKVQNESYSLSPHTTYTHVAANDYQMQVNLDTATPEPGTLMLGALGLGLIVVGKRRFSR